MRLLLITCPLQQLKCWSSTELMDNYQNIEGSVNHQTVVHVDTTITSDQYLVPVKLRSSQAKQSIDYLFSTSDARLQT